MQTKKCIVFLVVGVLLILIVNEYCRLPIFNKQQDAIEPTVSITDIPAAEIYLSREVLLVEVARTPEKKMLGLSGRESIYRTVTVDTDQMPISSYHSTRPAGVSGALLGVTPPDSSSDSRTYEGMLFVFENERKLSFWMKDMHFNIDMIWLDAGKRITHIEQNVGPESFPEIFSSPYASQYVLELDAFASAHHGIAVGDILSWEYK